MIKIARLFMLILILFLFTKTFAFSQEDAEGSKDCPYFSRMPNYYIWETGSREFDAHQFFNGKELVTVEGKLCGNRYDVKEGIRPASELQIARNYANAVKSLGGTVLFDGVCEDDRCGVKAGHRYVIGKITKGDKELWIEVCLYEKSASYDLNVIEKEAMRQVVTASDMLAALKTEGHIALYINFDINKAIIKAESKPIIDQIVQMMKEDPSLKISIEGHTDSTGNPQSNKLLSGQRAKAVFDALVQQGIDAKRMSTVGWGQEKPIADNSTEEGRAKNRRVELVKK